MQAFHFRDEGVKLGRNTPVTICFLFFFVGEEVFEFHQGGKGGGGGIILKISTIFFQFIS